nr:tetratricopeptide repeat protein [Myxococcus xanthus]
MVEVATGEPAAAEALLRQCQADEPERAEVAHALGDFLAGQGRPLDALAPLKRVAALEPAQWMYAFTLATVQLELGQTKEAIASLQNALHLNPSHSASYTALARILLLQGQRHEARQLLEAALPVVNEPAWVEGLLGSLLAGDGALEAGLMLLERALSAHPEHAGFNADKAQVLLSLGRIEELVSFCEALEQSGEASSATRLAWAEALEHERPEQALELYRQLMESDPGDWLAANAAGLLPLRESAGEAEALDEAREFLSLALERSNGRVEPALNLARVLLSRGEVEAGRDLARQVIAAVPSGPLRAEAEQLLALDTEP